jgi:hypothetical protein
MSYNIPIDSLVGKSLERAALGNYAYKIPVQTILSQAFGIYNAYGSRYKPGQLPVETETNIYSRLGTPVHFAMGFDGRTDYKMRVNGEIQEVSRKGMYLPFTSVASFTRSKRTTETYMLGQEGSIIEDYGFEPWNIRVQGLIIKDDKELVSGKSTVEEQVRELQSYEQLCDAIQLKGKLFEWLGIFEASIMSINYPELKNYNPEYVMPFEMNLRSSTPLELINV